MAKPLAYAARIQKEPYTITEEQKKAARERVNEANKKARLNKA